MKPATAPSRCLSSHLPSTLAAMSLGIAALGSHGQVNAEAVDSELVLLVDIGRPGLDKKEFDSLMDSYASTFTSSELLDSIQSGTYGRIAVSLLFYGSNSPQIGIPWMSIGTASEASQFAGLFDGLSRGTSSAQVDVAGGLSAAMSLFGTETGGTGNGFESSLQIIDVAAASIPKSSTGSDTAASIATLTAGVDVINSIAVGGQADEVANYYAANVVGSEIAGVQATSTSSSFGVTLTAALTDEITSAVNTPVTAVPEPSVAIGLTGILLILFRRRRV